MLSLSIDKYIIIHRFEVSKLRRCITKREFYYFIILLFRIIYQQFIREIVSEVSHFK